MNRNGLRKIRNDKAKVSLLATLGILIAFVLLIF